MKRKIVFNTEQKEKILKLIKEGKYDTEIEKIFNIDRKIIGKFRKEMSIERNDRYSKETISKIKELIKIKSIKEISSILNINENSIRYICNSNNIEYKKQNILNSCEDKIIELYNKGLMDTEIARELNCKDSSIWWYRKQHNLPTKFNYSKIAKIDNNKFEYLYNKGLSDSEIAKELNMSSDGIYSHRMRHHYYRESLSENKPIILTDFQKQVLLGTLLGDSSLLKSKKSKNPIVSCAHGIKQKEYCEYKTKIFKSLNAHCKYNIRKSPDKRNGKLYEDYTMRIPANPELYNWYNLFYINKIKVIPFNLFEYFTEVSLAFMYMDDGSKTQRSYQIATNCFTIDELNKFRAFLLTKFNLDTSLFKSNVLYIKANSRKTFEKLISPYMINSMKYKLHKVS